MRFFLPIRDVSRCVTCATFAGMIVAAPTIWAQQIQFGFMGRPSQVELTAPHVEVVSGATTSRLEQARALIASRNWDEAVDIYRELAAEKSNRVVAIDDGRYVNLRTYCHLQLARLPA